MQLMIFDPDFNFLGLIDGFESFRRVRRYNQVGEFELHQSFSLEAMALLQIGNIIWQKGATDAGYIKGRDISLSNDGKETLVVRGSSMSGYLEKRIIWTRENFNESPERIMRTLVNNHAINPSNPIRKIPLLKLGELKGYTGTIRKQVTYKNLLEAVQEVAKSNGLGFRTLVDVNSKELLFDVYKGTDRSKKVVFAREFENVLEQEYAEDVSNHRNVALVAGLGEGDDRKITVIDDGQAGLNRYELYVEAKDIDDSKTVNEEKVPLPESEYIELLEDRGQTRLAEAAKAESFDSKIHPQSNLIYQEDYDLGDIVTVKDSKWGLVVDERIMEIEEVYEQDGMSVFITFGDEPLGLIEKIKQVVD